MNGFAERLFDACRRKESVVCVGLDPRAELLPPEHRPATGDPDAVAAAYESFGRDVIDIVAPSAAALKPQAAFFEALGPPGFAAYCRLCDAARERGLLVIADVKRGDIGSTAEAYAAAWLGPRGSRPPLADACTVNAWLGADGVKPFADAARAGGGGIFVLVKTSNPSSGEIQDLQLADGGTVCERMAALVRGWAQPPGPSGYGPVGAVVGATWPAHLRELRRALPESVILIPGYGAQGAAAADVADGFDADGLGAIVNASRSITFPWGRPERCPAAWREAIRDAATAMRAELNAALAARPR